MDEEKQFSEEGDGPIVKITITPKSDGDDDCLIAGPITPMLL